ncbi:hypothetical protein COLO4_23311 [Corchorus olitorius]|uniref:Uncharacterized protein n=1 Tax=Corchorus olitorius TaxID=93759 RepID=A0A1R3IHK0_9ROSI|nr:hypothetical protein COLO4_23311 [Corchorus olitorius]
MEKHKIGQRRKKVELSIMRNNGSGLEGVIVLGALAIASLIAAFTIKKGRKNGNEGTTNLEATDSCKKEDNGEEESSEGTSSSTESNTEDAIWPAEMVGFLSLEPKEMNISQKLEEKHTTAKIEEYNNLASTEKLVTMNDKKEHLAEAKRQIWVWFSIK